MQLDATHVVLVQPRRASNLGAVARAMKNFGMRRLTLVASRIGSWTDAWPAIATSCVATTCR